MLPLLIKTILIAVLATLLILTLLYVFYAGTLRSTRGRLRITRDTSEGGRSGRRRDDVERAEAGQGVGGDGQSVRSVDVRSVDTLPRYTVGDGGAVGQMVHGIGEGEGRGEGEGEGRGRGEEVKPPAYVFDAGGVGAGKSGDGDEEGDIGDGEGRTGLPASPDAVHVSGSERVS